VRYAFIEREERNHSIALMCEVLVVSRSGFYKWKQDRDGIRKRRHDRLLQLIHKIFQQSRNTYGIRRVHAQLRRQGENVNRKLVEKLMHQYEIQPKRKRRFKSTTDSKHSLPVSNNELQRAFAVEKPNSVWVSDITYVDTSEGWLYLATFIDLYSRKVVGWSMNERMTADLVVSAFDMAVKRRGMSAPKLVHSDRGSQYASETFRSRLKKCKQSMSRKGNCWDNAVAESFFGALKSELIHRQLFKTRKEAEISIFDYIEIFYNKNRLHSTLGYVSPTEFEEKDRKAA
jgi:transposase InsO family protein